MFKTKLLILLLINLSLMGCIGGNNMPNNKFELNYVAGGVDGLMLRNLLESFLKNTDMYYKDADLKIDVAVDHQKMLYITNVDNTSDRERITSIINAQIKSSNKDCTVLDYKYETSQFYVIASSENYTSNSIAVEQIKIANLEILIQRFLSKIRNKSLSCIDDI